MAVKTITVTEKAYNVLKALKAENESFSEAILRMGRKRSLMEFAGALSNESAEKLRKSVRESRRRYTELHERRMQRILKALEAPHGGS